MSPTGATVLWNVLVETVCEVRHAVNVSPRKIIRKILLANVCEGKRRGIVVPDLVVL
jgi:hypothetical protein